jgi:predicted dehydrogenase
MYWLLDSEPVSVSAYSLPADRKEPIGENNLVACLRFADGSIGNLTYATAGSKTSGGERVEVFAQGLGVFTEDFKRLAVRTGSSSNRSSMWGDKGYMQQMVDFLAAIREGRTAEVTALDGARATIGCLAMLESARTLAPVAIDLEAALAPDSAA